MEEKDTVNNAPGSDDTALPETTAASPSIPEAQSGGREPLTGAKIRNIADWTGLFIDFVFIVVGVLVWSRYDSLTGFFIGFLIMCGGVFVSYVMVSIMYGYGDIVSNSIEQTRILQRLEAQKLSELPEPEEAEPPQPAAEKPAPQPIRPVTPAEPAEDEGDWEQVEITAPGSKSFKAPPTQGAPLRGVFDAKMRRVAHFAERSRHGIICPICERIQDSFRNDCYFCDCKFVYDDEPFNNTSYQVTDRLRY